MIKFEGGRSRERRGLASVRANGSWLESRVTSAGLKPRKVSGFRKKTTNPSGCEEGEKWPPFLRASQTGVLERLCEVVLFVFAFIDRVRPVMLDQVFQCVEHFLPDTVLTALQSHFEVAILGAREHRYREIARLQMKTTEFIGMMRT